MVQLWPVFVVAALAAVGWYLWRGRQQRIRAALEQVPHYVRRDRVLNPSEAAYFEALSKSLGGRTTVFPKVRLADLVQHPGAVPQYRAHWMRVQRRSVDFLVCDHNSFPVLAIVMESRAEQKKRRLRSDVLGETLDLAGIPLLQVLPREEYDAQEVVHEIKLTLQRESDKPQHAMPRDATTPSISRKLKRWTSDLWLSMRGA